MGGAALRPAKQRLWLKKREEGKGNPLGEETKGTLGVGGAQRRQRLATNKLAGMCNVGSQPQRQGEGRGRRRPDSVRGPRGLRGSTAPSARGGDTPIFDVPLAPLEPRRRVGREGQGGRGKRRRRAKGKRSGVRGAGGDGEQGERPPRGGEPGSWQQGNRESRGAGGAGAARRGARARELGEQAPCGGAAPPAAPSRFLIRFGDSPVPPPAGEPAVSCEGGTARGGGRGNKVGGWVKLGASVPGAGLSFPRQKLQFPSGPARGEAVGAGVGVSVRL